MQRRLKRAKWRGSMRASRSGTDGLLPRHTRLPAPWEADSFLELRVYLASCLEPCETLGGICPEAAMPHPEASHLFDIGIDIPLFTLWLVLINSIRTSVEG